MRDMVSKDRHARLKGTNHGRAKLTREQVLEIREKYVPWKYSTHKLAEEYGVSEMTIHRIVKRKLWTHI